MVIKLERETDNDEYVCIYIYKYGHLVFRCYQMTENIYIDGKEIGKWNGYYLFRVVGLISYCYYAAIAHRGQTP